MELMVMVKPKASIFSVVLFLAIICGDCGVTSPYRRPREGTVDMPLQSDVFSSFGGYNSPEQVHITQGDYEGKAMIISWVTPVEAGSNTVVYGKRKGHYDYSAEGFLTRYKFNYSTSGFIHHCTIKDLEYNTRYYYKLGSGRSSRDFWFDTPPEINPDAPYTFGILGDLGQTFDSNKTFEHYLQSHGQAVLYVGDMCYADCYFRPANFSPLEYTMRWDTWAQFLEPSTAYQPWIWTVGDHEIEYNPSLGELEPFKRYKHRYHVPYQASDSSSPLWYAIKRASTHIIVLSSFSAYGTYTPQSRWLQVELERVDRKKTPWLIILIHTPWYNSNEAHYMEGETMRVQYEEWLVDAKADIVLSGHVHAYERTHRISNTAYNIVNGKCMPVRNNSAPVYITIGDGGNVEGLHSEFTEPQPEYSAFRESSFGHAILEIKNRTHAFYYWHRNQDGKPVVADSYWLLNRYWEV